MYPEPARIKRASRAAKSRALARLGQALDKLADQPSHCEPRHAESALQRPEHVVAVVRALELVTGSLPDDKLPDDKTAAEVLEAIGDAAFEIAGRRHPDDVLLWRDIFALAWPMPPSPRRSHATQGQLATAQGRAFCNLWLLYAGNDEHAVKELRQEAGLDEDETWECTWRLARGTSSFGAWRQKHINAAVGNARKRLRKESHKRPVDPVDDNYDLEARVTGALDCERLMEKGLPARTVAIMAARVLTNDVSQAADFFGLHYETCRVAIDRAKSLIDSYESHAQGTAIQALIERLDCIDPAMPGKVASWLIRPCAAAVEWNPFTAPSDALAPDAQTRFMRAALRERLPPAELLS